MIREYKEGDHNSGFIGLRVAVYVDRRLRQRYFNFKKLTLYAQSEARREATKLEKTWLADQREARFRNSINAPSERESSPYATGALGITFSVAGRYCYFIVSGSTDKKTFSHSFNINNDGFDWAWNKACIALNKAKKYERITSPSTSMPIKERLLVCFKQSYFNHADRVYIDALSGVFNKRTILNYCIKLLEEYPDHLEFKADVIEYAREHKLYQKKLMELI